MRGVAVWLACALGLGALSLGGLCVRAQVVQISAGTSSAADTQGGSVTVYSGGAATRLSLGSVDGLRLGFSREVETENSQLAVGDTSPSLALLTDGGQTQRTVYAQGVRLRMHTTNNQVEVFSGRSGEQRGNALFSTVLPDKSLTVVNAVGRSGPLQFQTLLMRGDTSAALSSVARKIGERTMVAVTAGMSAHRMIVRGWMHSEGATWRLDVGDTSGHLRLQPEPRLMQFEAEQIGVNVSLSKRVGQHLQVDGARHEYATSATDSKSSMVVLGARSILWEAGATMRVSSLQTGLRGVMSRNAQSNDMGVAWITGWHRPRWDTQMTVLSRPSPSADAGTTVQLDGGERINRYLRLEQGAQLGTGMPRFDMGGVVEGNRGSLRVSHGETYVPYGPAVGFRRVLTVALQWHVHNATVQVARVSASGIETEYDGNVSDFEGSGLGTVANVRSPGMRMMRYRVRGLVREVDGSVVAGAAVAVGSQTVYTDSEGRWMARFPTARAVRVSIQPSEFLTSLNFATVTAPTMADPEEDPAEMELKVARCRCAPVGEAVMTTAGEMGAGAVPSRFRRLRGTGRLLLRMVRVWAW